MIRAFLFLVFGMAALTSEAVTVTNSNAGASASITVTWDAANSRLAYSYTCVANGTGPGGNSGTITQSAAAQIVTTTGNGGPEGVYVLNVHNGSNSMTGTGSGTIPGSPGSWYIIYAYTASNPPGTHTPSNYGLTYWQVAASEYKVTVSLRNNRDVPVRYKLMQGSTVLGQVTLQPGQALIQQFTTTSTDPVTVYEEVDGLSFDGTNWILVEGAVTTKNVTPGSGITPVPTGQPSTPTQVNPSPDIPKSVNPTPKADNAPVWKNPTPNNNPTGQVDLLTNSVFREGVDKLGSALNSIDATLSERDSNPTGAVFPQEFTETLSATGATEVNALVSKLPTVPQVLPSSIGTNSHFQFTLKFPPLTQSFFVDVDMAPYATPITFIRGIMKACLSILFFFLIVNTLKKAVS